MTIVSAKNKELTITLVSQNFRDNELYLIDLYLGFTRNRHLRDFKPIIMPYATCDPITGLS